MNIGVKMYYVMFIKTVTDYTAKATSEKLRRLQYGMGVRNNPERGSCDFFGKLQLDAKMNKNHYKKELNWI